MRADADAAVPRGARGGGGGDGGGGGRLLLGAVGRRRRPSYRSVAHPGCAGRRLGRLGLLLRFDRTVLLRIHHRPLSEGLEKLGAPRRSPLAARVPRPPQARHISTRQRRARTEVRAQTARGVAEEVRWRWRWWWWRRWRWGVAARHLHASRLRIEKLQLGRRRAQRRLLTERRRRASAAADSGGDQKEEVEQEAPRSASPASSAS